MNTIGMIFGVDLGIIGLVVFTIIKRNNKPKIKEFLSEERQYNRWKWLIDHHIEKKEWNDLEEMLDSSVKDFPDLIEKIEDALKNK